MSQYLPYTVEVSTFADAALAEEQRKQIADKGYYTFTMNVKGQSHRVCVGRFGTEQEAQKTADGLKKKGIAGFVTTI